MKDGNAIIHQATRLKIMASLCKLAPNSAVEFVRLREIIATTDGNLGAHLEALAGAGYVAIDKRFEDRKPKTRVKATAAGRRAFAEHVAYLREIIDDGDK